MESSAVNLLKRIVEVYSPSGHEAELSHYLCETMEASGLVTHIDGVGNVFGEFGRGSPEILLCGHMDTIPGRLPVRLEDNRLYGRGAVDAKASLAAMIKAASMLRDEKNFPAKLVVACVVDEEASGRGIKQLISDNVRADYAIFGEPSGVEQITVAYKGSLRVRVDLETVTGHSSAPWLFENAVEQAFEVYLLLQKISFPSERKDSKFYSLSSSLTKIAGGSSSSKVPSRCSFQVDFRIPPKIRPVELFREVERITREYCKRKPSVTIKVGGLDSCEPYEADTSSLLVRSFSWAVRMVRKKPATWVRKTGTGDMNVYGSSMKIPVVTYGAGDSRLDHTSNEWIDLKEYEDSTEVLCKGIKRLLELDSKMR